jgi:hypothetical protein
MGRGDRIKMTDPKNGMNAEVKKIRDDIATPVKKFLKNSPLFLVNV